MEPVYLRWYSNGQPQQPGQRMESEGAAKAAVLQKFPTAIFRPKTPTRNSTRRWLLTRQDYVLYVYQQPCVTTGAKPIAEICLVQ